MGCGAAVASEHYLYITTHEGAVWASPGGQPAGLACAAEGEAISPPADPTGAHPEGPGQDTADWDFGVRGQSGPRCYTRGAGGHLRAGLSRVLVWFPPRA